MDTPRPDPMVNRYARQILFDRIGEEGQRALRDSDVALIGCGALGSALACTLVRAGVGRLRILDRDFIVLDNLQRQVLFDEEDIARNLPKAEAAAAKLRRINSEVTVDPVVTDVHHSNIRRLTDGADLLLDGTDNFETRYLINDLAVCEGRPWVYGAVIGAGGLMMPVLPGKTACLRCLFEDVPPPEMNPTCDTAGVIAPAVQIVAAFQAVEAIKILTRRWDEVSEGLLQIDAWTGRVVRMNVRPAFERGRCPCCKNREFPYLEGRLASSGTVICGRTSVQIRAPEGTSVDFEMIARKLHPVAAGTVRHNRFMLKADVEGYELTLFPDGRAIIKGTAEVERARSVYAKYVGA